MNKKLLLSILICSSGLIANMDPKTGFIPFPNYYFVETGTFGGDGIAFALQGDFTEIHSLEIEPSFVRGAKYRFKEESKVTIHQCDSGKDLYDIIKDMDKPITFWLDGHNGTPDKNGGKNTPLIEELEQIKRHPIKTHTIIIDDMHCCNTILFDFLSREDIVKKVKEINPDYNVYFIAGGNDGEYPQNILVAEVK